MPCYDPTPDEIVEHARRDFRHNSDVAELLCAVLKQIDRSAFTWTPELKLWWYEHQCRDMVKGEG